MPTINPSKQAALIRLENAVWDWLVVNGMERDTNFCSVEEWKQRGEEFHLDSELVLVTEGSLHFELNFGDPEIFYDLVESFGFYYELGHSWDLGFYEIENYFYDVPKGDYKSLLTDERWKNKSKKVKERAENKCQDCGNNYSLEAHHSYYKWGHAIWEYPVRLISLLMPELS